MSYRRAEQVLPAEVIEIIQNYVDGACIYIPRKDNTRQEWGTSTSIRSDLEKRNTRIYRDYIRGEKTAELARKYFLSEKSIQRIVRQMKQAVR